MQETRAAVRHGRGGQDACSRRQCGHSGAGFTPEDLAGIFEPFFSRRRGGTGLGLAIAQCIVEAHGGTIAASNDSQGGGVMSVRLPCAPG